MSFELIGLTIKTLGELFVAYTVLRVHRRVLDERKIDAWVIKGMRFEQLLGVIGAVLIIIGFFMEGGYKLLDYLTL